MNVRLIDRQPAEVAYLRHTGPYGEQISQFWQRQVLPWMIANNLLGRTRYGVSLDDPSVTKPQLCRYDACVEVAQVEMLSGKAMRKVIPGGKFAALAFHGTARDVEIAWDRILRDWLPSSGLQLDARPFLEHYPPTAAFDPATGKFECELCVPVSPL